MTRVLMHHLAFCASDAGRLAAQLRTESYEIETHRFPDGELRVKVGPIAPTVLIYCPLSQPNEKLLILLFAAEALRRNGVKRLVLIAPYMCYMRQDTAFRPGEAISQRVIGDLLARAFDRIITVDAHLHRTGSLRDVFLGVEADELSAVPAIAKAIRARGIDLSTLVVGPDEESQRSCRLLAEALGVEAVIGRKKRYGDQHVQIKIPRSEVIRNRPIILFDDIISSGGTVLACADTLLQAGAQKIDLVVTHALFGEKIMLELLERGVSSIVSTHTVSHCTSEIFIDEILLSALQKEFHSNVGCPK